MSEVNNDKLLVIEIVPKGTPKTPKWQRLMLLDLKTKEVYIPAVANPTGNEATAVLSASWDGQPLASYGKHAFLSLAWMRLEYPGWSELYTVMQENADRAFRDLAAGTL